MIKHEFIAWGGIGGCMICGKLKHCEERVMSDAEKATLIHGMLWDGSYVRLVRDKFFEEINNN